jgi:hypothetical protein
MTDMPAPADLVGAWELDNWRITFSDDRPDTYPYGEDAKGALIYEASGRMAVMVSNADRPAISGPNIRRAPVEEKVAAFDSFFGYSGRWRLDGDHFVGTDQVRGVEYTPGALTLIEQSTTRTGAVMRNQLAWRKIS